MKLFKSFCVAASLLASTLSLSANATIIPAGFSLDGNIVSDTNQGLEWLRWDQTLNLSFAEADDIYGALGYKLATTLQVNTLLSDFGFLQDDFDLATSFSIETAFQRGDTNSDELHRSFLAIFGSTQPSFGEVGDTATGTFARFDSGRLEEGVFGFTRIVDDFLRRTGGGRLRSTDARVESFSNTNTMGDAQPFAGFVFVRDQDGNGNTMEVPEPGLFSLLALGLIGIAVRRRRARLL